MTPTALLINPWIYDFAAFDMWAVPLGLLSIAAILRNTGWDVSFVDCTSRQHPSIADKVPHEKPYHCGQYFAEEVGKPEAISWVPRRYKRYGIPEEVFIQDIRNAVRPDVILVTSRMTYWYPGVHRVIEIVRDVFPRTPIILGGTYATLCPDHARAVCKPDILFSGEAEEKICSLIEQTVGVKMVEHAGFNGHELDSLPFPAWDLLPSQKALPIETSRGCPYSCAYCASGRLFSGFRKKSAGRVTDEIEYAVASFGTEDFSFNDDALLFNAPTHFEKIADEVSRRGLYARFHTPNSVFANAITPAVSEKLRAMNFHTIRLSLETTNVKRLKKMNRKILPRHFDEAMKNLRAAGFTKKEVGAYIMVGLPRQGADEVREAIDYSIARGATPHLAEYSPIPGTPAWEEAVASARLDIRNELLLHNNSIFYMLGGSFDRPTLEELKRYALTRQHSEGDIIQYERTEGHQD
jgi:radical SAM superfamily enzyme YgiQ (UPF0313 family)